MQQEGNRYLMGWQYKLYQASALRRAWQIARQSYPSFYEAGKAMWGLLKNNRTSNRYRHLNKAVIVGDRVFSMMCRPGLPSPAMEMLLQNELNRIVPIPGFQKGLLLMMLAITKKCSMQCAHCYEWEALNHKEVLSVDNLLGIIRKFQERGLGNVDLGGGEPLNRFNDLLEVLRRSDTHQTDFWITTSGYRLDAERARQLKAAGLTGVAISLDHWDAAEHDCFRGLPGAFDWAVQAAHNTRAAGLVVGLNVVATRAFCTPEHLWRYMELAKSLGVHFVRPIDPRRTGHFAMSEQEVELEKQHWSVLEDFHRKIQHNPAYRDYPVVEYHGAFNRAIGCGGAGDRHLYIDTDGDFHACPFCRHKCGSALDGNFEAGLAQLRAGAGCHKFHAVGAVAEEVTAWTNH